MNKAGTKAFAERLTKRADYLQSLLQEHQTHQHHPIGHWEIVTIKEVEALRAGATALEAPNNKTGLKELRKFVDAHVREWETRFNKAPGILHEASGIIGAWFEVRQEIDKMLLERTV